MRSNGSNGTVEFGDPCEVYGGEFVDPCEVCGELNELFERGSRIERIVWSGFCEFVFAFVGGCEFVGEGCTCDDCTSSTLEAGNTGVGSGRMCDTGIGEGE